MQIDRSRYCIRVVDDDDDLLQAIELSLRLDGWQVLTYSSAEDFLENDDVEAPGCLILDVQLPEISGPELQERLKEAGIFLPVIFLTAYANVDLTIHAFREGACDFLTKPVNPLELAEALMKAVESDERHRRELQKQRPSVRFEVLTEREREIAPLVAAGLTSAVIGERLGRSPRTIERHRAVLLRKLNLHTPQELKIFLDELAKERS